MEPRSRSWFIRTTTLALPAGSLLPCAAGAAPAFRAEKPSLKMGVPVDAASFLPIYVAAARTWADQGLDVQLVSFRGGAEAKQALAGDSLDLIYDSPTGLLSMIAANQPVMGIFAGCNQTDFS